MAGDTNLDALSAGVKAFKDADLRITEEGARAYTDELRRLRDTIESVKSQIDSVRALQPVGDLLGAIQTKSNLEGAVTQPGGILEVLDNYLVYLTDLESTIQSATQRMLEAG